MNCTQTQGFYDNANNAYTSMKPPMLGHGGIDINCGYGTAIEFPLDGIVSNVLDASHPASDGFWAVYVICNYKGQIGELCVGHCATINVKVGDNITKGQIIGTEGNHGLVYENGVLITLAMQATGDTRGHHRHWQWRPLIKTNIFNPAFSYITSWGMGTYKDKDAYFYQVKDPNNGFHGLSPDISSILSDYTTTMPNQTTVLSTALGQLKQILLKLLASLN